MIHWHNIAQKKDKEPLEQLARMLGWVRLHWSDDPYNQAKTVLKGSPSKSAWERVFPPSRNDGNGMIWLMDELCKVFGKKINQEFAFNEDRECDITIELLDPNMDERTTLALFVEAEPLGINSLPRLYNLAALKALESKES